MFERIDSDPLDTEDVVTDWENDDDDAEEAFLDGTELEDFGSDITAKGDPSTEGSESFGGF